jgi:hypothetical protein
MASPFSHSHRGQFNSRPPARIGWGEHGEPQRNPSKDYAEMLGFASSPPSYAGFNGFLKQLRKARITLVSFDVIQGAFQEA